MHARDAATHDDGAALLKRSDDVLPTLEENCRASTQKPSWKSLIRTSPRGIPVLFITRFLYALTPQLIRTRYFDDPIPPTKIHSTSWMNGIRGIAAIAVFNLHYFYFFTYKIFAGYGTGPPDRYIHQLPILQLVCDGVCGVVIFFTVAGYVCSYKPLQAMTAGDSATLFKSLPASVFRRWFRLYLPVFCSTFCICTLAYVGAYEPTRFLFVNMSDRSIWPGPGDEPQPPRYPTLAGQFGYWWASVSRIMNFWTEYPTDPPIDFHLWTIVYEYRASMYLYVVLLSLAVCKPRVRICILLLLGYVNVVRFAHWELVCFLYGAVLAQLNVLRSSKGKYGPEQCDQLSDARERANDDTSVLLRSRELDKDVPTLVPLCYPPPRSHISFAAFGRRAREFGALASRSTSVSTRTLSYLVALYLMSFPVKGVKWPAPFYSFIIPFIPPGYGVGTGPKFTKQVGVLILMYLLTTIPIQQRSKSLWHRVLTSGPSQYLGSIMFGLYLIHGMVLHVFGIALPHYFWRRWCSENDGNVGVPQQSMTMYLFGLFIGYVVSLTVALWAADVWTREVEGRCVKVTKWLEGWMFVT